MTPKRIQELRNAYHGQRHDAVKRRGIAFKLTFEEWLDIWVKSKHLRQRGNKRGKYVMARFGDCGPYSIHNVSIISFEANSREHGINMGRLRKTPFFKKEVQRSGTKASLAKYPHGALALLADEQIAEIRFKLRNARYGDNRKIAKEYGVSDAIISQIKRGVSYKLIINRLTQEN